VDAHNKKSSGSATRPSGQAYPDVDSNFD